MPSVVIALAVLLFSGLYSGDVFFTSGPRDKKNIAFTFDDGPQPLYTDQVLRILEQNSVKATFFMLGSQVEKHPEIARRVLEAGHEIASHTYGHLNFAKQKKVVEKVVAEIEVTERIFKESLGIQPRFLRMPHGFHRQWLDEIAKEKGYRIVNWSFGCDWLNLSTATLRARYTKNLHPGAVLLFHDGGGRRPRTVSVLPDIIQSAKSQGLKPVTVSELLEAK